MVPNGAVVVADGFRGSCRTLKDSGAALRPPALIPAPGHEPPGPERYREDYQADVLGHVDQADDEDERGEQ